MPIRHFLGITVPFTVEEVQRLTKLAELDGGSLIDLIRARVFGPDDEAAEAPESEDEDLTTLMARLEGMRIRRRRRD